jgi:hypothetical protein
MEMLSYEKLVDLSLLKLDSNPGEAIEQWCYQEALPASGQSPTSHIFQDYLLSYRYFSFVFCPIPPHLHYPCPKTKTKHNKKTKKCGLEIISCQFDKRLHKTLTGSIPFQL